MSSNRSFRAVMASLSLMASLAISGCGQMGEAESGERILQQNTDFGCLDGIGKQISRYSAGTIEASEWESTFDCVIDKIGYFKRYVRGSVPNGYDPADIDALIKKFLITKKPISARFVRTVFQIKASMAGGSQSVITPAEIDRFVELAKLLKGETLRILPSLVAKRKGPSPADLDQLAESFSVAGVQLSGFFGAGGNGDLTEEDYLAFAKELLDLTGGDPTMIDENAAVVSAVKVIVADGAPRKIEPRAWTPLVREGAAMAGAFIAYRSAEAMNNRPENSKSELYLSLIHRLQPSLERVMASRQGGIPFELIDPVIDSVPVSNLSAEKREALKKDLRPIVNRVLQAEKAGTFDIKALRTAIRVFEQGVRGQVLVEHIFKGLPVAATPAQFETEATNLAARVSTEAEKEEIKELIQVSKLFTGLYPENTNEMILGDSAFAKTRTSNHMIRMQWFRKVVRQLFSVYATGKDASGTNDDLTRLATDFQNILLAWKMAHPSLSIQEVAMKRFREANLFMPSSNGDKLIDQIEATYYVAFLFSSGALSGRIYDSIVHDWKSCPIIGMDELGQPAMEAQCFRNEYYANAEKFWQGFPGLIRAYRKMSESSRKALQKSMETAARRTGYSELPIGPYDIDSLAALPHYVEDIMARFDANRDDVLSKSEVLNRAYPVFRGALMQISGKKADWILQAALTYAVKYGTLPKTKWEQAKLLAWAAWRPFWKISANRGALYRVIAMLSEPVDATKETRGVRLVSPYLLPEALDPALMATDLGIDVDAE